MMRNNNNTNTNTNNNINNNNRNQDEEQQTSTLLTMIDRTYKMNPKEVDALLSQELNQLSLKDREKTMEEIHGIHALSVAQTETKMKIDVVLQQLQEEIDNIKNEEKDAYNEAIENKSRYVMGQKFRLKFVRAEEYNVKKAARRMVDFLEFVKELYGPQVLMRPIRYTDLSDNAQTILQDGSMQILPERDPSGRRVALMSGDVGLKFSIVDRVRN
jgi:hypothetical protein